MGRSSLFAPEHEESESTAEGDPLRLSDNDEDDDDEDEEQTQVMVGAGIASGTLGLWVVIERSLFAPFVTYNVTHVPTSSLVGGPFFAVLLGFGTAYATQKDGAVGDSARAVGHVARTAQEQAKAVDQKHHLLEKSQHLAKQAWQKARALDRKYHVLDTAVDVVQFSWNATKNFCQRHYRSLRGNINGFPGKI